MLDPLSFSASLIAVTGLVGTVFRTSQTLYAVAKQVQSASEDIEKFALDMRNFGIVMDIGHGCLESFFSTCEPTSPLFTYFKDLEVMESLAAETELTRKGIRRARRKIESARSRNQTYAHLKWVFRKKYLDALFPGMERLKSNFTLMMAYVNFEVAQKRGDSEETRRELQVPNSFNLDTIDLLQQSERRRMRESGETQGIYHSHPVSASHEIQDKLSFLGTQIMEHDTVPDPKEYTPFSSRVFSSQAFSNDYFTGSYAHRAPVHPSQSSESSNSRSQRAEYSTSTATSPISSVATTVESREVRIMHGGPPELRQERRRIPLRRESQSSASSELSVLSDDPPHLPSPMEHVKGKSIASVEEDFISVGPKNHLLRLDPGRPVKSIQGFIHTDEEASSTTVLIDKALDYNLISLADVQRFGLEMEPPDDEEPVYFHTEQGEKKSCGKVIMLWSEGRPSRKPFRVRCLVYGHDVRPLLFGRPFLDRRRHYWGDDDEDSEVEAEERMNFQDGQGQSKGKGKVRRL
ncbi:hypothetical protein N431DRAFT_551386 [Stipitochalara longipes BDJ]|nr:hypothetical protein N431DRAFT_551386 [Stipitochalara longipes BDJ]